MGAKSSALYILTKVKVNAVQISMTACERQFENRARSSWGADNLFANVATIRTDAFWFSAMP